MSRNQYIRLICLIGLLALVIFKPLTFNQRLILLVCACVLAATEIIERKLFDS